MQEEPPVMVGSFCISMWFAGVLIAAPRTPQASVFS